MQQVAVLKAEGTHGRAMAAGTMPLSAAGTGCRLTIQKIRGGQEQRGFLQGLGFVEGTVVSVVNQNGGNLIVETKGARVALGCQMAARIMVTPEQGRHG